MNVQIFFAAIPDEKFRHTHKFLVGNFIGYGLDRHIIVSLAAVLLGGTTIKLQSRTVCQLLLTWYELRCAK